MTFSLNWNDWVLQMLSGNQVVRFPEWNSRPCCFPILRDSASSAEAYVEPAGPPLSPRGVRGVRVGPGPLWPLPSGRSPELRKGPRQGTVLAEISVPAEWSR